MSSRWIGLVCIAAMLLVVPVLFDATPTEGLEIKADQSLSNSHASFFSRGVSFHSGRAVSGAGDVNGDGFDDFLIGAHYDSDDGNQAGKTYLILGKASGWTMDTNLSNADASFVGEAADDWSGSAVSGAGDVNGDGFDDILIGAHRNDFGQNNTGKTYLILGKASGWTRDTNLSTADASFVGEDILDKSGYAVSGAGDVNGDGFDDLLIGARGNDDGGDYAGQTYLILGKASGWAVDTNLSAADASFWGEDYMDESGYSVSDAGDVNGDGYDDFIIGAPGDEEGGDRAGQTYLILGKSSGWEMDTDLSNADASFWGEAYVDGSGISVAGVGDVNGDGFDDLLIGAAGNDDGGDAAGQTYLILGKASGWAMNRRLHTANASFWGEDEGDYSGISVAGAGDINNDGYDDILIGAYTNDDGGVHAGQTYLILGKASGWAMDTDLSNADASFWGEVVGAYSGQTVAGAGDVNGDGYDDILIGAYINNVGGRSGGQVYLLCFDRAPPEFLEDLTPLEATTGDAFSFTVSVLDHSSVDDVSVEFWFGDSQDHLNRSMAMLSGDRYRGTWALDITIPSDSLKPLHYMILALDPEGNQNRTVERRVNVTDNDRPMIEPGGNYTIVTTGQTLTLAVNVTDNIGVQDVRLIYAEMYAYGETYNYSMVPADIDTGGNGTYAIDNITVNPLMLHDLEYYFSAVDTSGNWIRTNSTRVEVLDDDRPVLVADLSDTVAFTGSTFDFTINLTDNVHIGDVHVEYWFGEDPSGTVNASMDPIGAWSRLGTFSLSVQIPLDSIEPLHYHFAISDSSGNWNRSETVSVDVTDNVPPVAVAGEDDSVDQGKAVDLDGTASGDNIDVASYTWTFTHMGEEVERTGPTMSYTFEFPALYEVTLTVEDAAGNDATDIVVVVVLDTEPPVAAAGDDVSVDQHTIVILDGSGCTDNVGVVDYLWVLDYDITQWELPGMSPEFTFDIVGEYKVFLQVTDVAGNWAMDNVTVTVLDTDPPVAAAGDDITLEEGDSLTLDASASTDNVGVVSWTWTFQYNGSEERLEGRTTSFTFHVPGTYTIALEVVDAAGLKGTDTVVVTVEDVPDDKPDKKEEESPGVAAAFVVVAFVAMAVAIGRRRRG